MHSFSELVYRVTTSTLSALEKLKNQIAQELQNSSASHLVKALQTIRLQKAVIAVGIFSMFEAALQDRLRTEYGFQEARKYLSRELLTRFEHYLEAINVLKHGRGRSYDSLLKKRDQLPFRILLPEETKFDEGDVSEVLILIDVDDQFVIDCVEIIRDISLVIENANPETI